MMEFKIPEHITWKNLDQGFVLLDLRSSNYYTLNQTASIIWEGLISQMSEAEVISKIQSEFDCDAENCIADIKEQLKYWIDEGLVESSNN